MRCRVGLFAGLISFNALASCANTERTLGMGLCQSKETKKQRELERQYKDQMKKLNNRSSINKDSWYNSKSCYATIAGTATSVITGLLWYLYYNVPSESTTEPTMANTTMPFPGNGTTNVVADGAPLAPVVNTTMAYVGNAIATAATAATTVLPTVGLIAVLKNGTNSVVMPSMSDTNTIRNKNTPKLSNIKPITILSQEIIDDIIVKNGFSTGRIEHWLNQGLHIDAKDEEGRTLLMEAVNSNSFTAIVFLMGKGANVNEQDNRENTPLMYAIHRKLEEIAEFLVTYGATPCKKNIDGRPSQSDIEPLNAKLLEEKFKKCS